jgi:hypothetical protein
LLVETVSSGEVRKSGREFINRLVEIVSGGEMFEVWRKLVNWVECKVCGEVSDWEIFWGREY